MSVDDSEYAMCDTLNPIWYPGSGIWHSYVTPIPIHETTQEYEGVDLDAVVDLGEVQEVSQISAGFLQDVGSWIFFPVEIQFFTSLDGETFTPAGISNHELSQKDFEPRTLEQWIDMNPPVQTRFVWVVAKNPGVCPDWHPGAGNPCWIFVDEISVE